MIEKEEEPSVPAGVNTLSEAQLTQFNIDYPEEEEAQRLRLEELTALEDKSMEEFVQQSFRKWGWSSEAMHKKNIEAANDLINQEGISKELKAHYQHFKKCLIKERTLYRKELEDEFLFTCPSFVKGVQYCRSKNEFRALMIFKGLDKIEGVVKVQRKNIKVPRSWMDLYFKPDAINLIMNLDVENGYVRVPPPPKPKEEEKKDGASNAEVKDGASNAEENDGASNGEVKDGASIAEGNDGEPKGEIIQSRIIQFPITRIRYLKQQTKNVVDMAALEKMIKQRDQKDAYRQRRAKPGVFVEPTPIGEKPRKQIVVPAHWIALHANGLKKKITEEELVELFGEAYLNQVKRSEFGFIDVPVGDFKESHLFKFPELIKKDAPRLRYIQSEGQDLCVSKAFASILHHLGFTDSARQVDEYGCQNLTGGAVDVVFKVKTFADKATPGWLLSRHMLHPFDWKDLKSNEIFLGVLLGSDGSNSHAVCIHGGWIFDANEIQAIPLTKQGLDYCTSNSEKECQFIRFWKGYFFYYEGKKKEKMAQMIGP